MSLVLKFSAIRFIVWNKPVFTMNLHSACRNKLYFVNARESIPRLNVPDEKVSWLVPWSSYKPPSFTSPGLSGQPWADPDSGTPGFSPNWNAVDDGVNRESLVCLYDVHDNCPLNPSGRTGMAGRGRLGRWGPNHAVDAVVTRWKTSSLDQKIVNPDTNCPVLQFISIQRRDTGEWALPGGMVDRGESSFSAVQREFLEEALNTPNVAGFYQTEMGKTLKEFFDKGKIVYKGYVDDPRNTDNAWMETTAYLFHDDDGRTVSLIEIEAGDDAAKAQWVDVNKELRLYASHAEIIKEVVSILGAHW